MQPLIPKIKEFRWLMAMIREREPAIPADKYVYLFQALVDLQLEVTLAELVTPPVAERVVTEAIHQWRMEQEEMKQRIQRALRNHFVSPT